LVFVASLLSMQH